MGKRLLLIVSCCVVGFLLVFFLISSIPEESPDEEEREEEKKEVVSSPPVVVKETELRGWEEGKLVWLLQAQDMELNNDNTKAICRGGVKLIVYQEEKEKTTIQAQEAEINLDDKDFYLKGGVEVLSSSGDKIVTSELRYRDKDKVLETEEEASVYFDGNFIHCRGLRSDVDFENPEFYQIIKGSFRLSAL
ncbi:MAG TPA: LPS export ABC transporter periplasmic protein LptC [Candidatus Atribacteria bacterium]|nr:LPS export ABC transporter periplasmic protein LptC [Candidatus Atribacteria bacterium]HPU08640.1 LPS export ABC transporter periplasmic protein LptC [Candidatus Atribacteria bacterium]HQE25598.1 LPS export ABC transporter periplasmic protein LptC [Candidatus Atribacteria bacterium]